MIETLKAYAPTLVILVAILIQYRLVKWEYRLHSVAVNGLKDEIEKLSNSSHADPLGARVDMLDAAVTKLKTDLDLHMATVLTAIEELRGGRVTSKDRRIGAGDNDEKTAKREIPGAWEPTGEAITSVLDAYNPLVTGDPKAQAAFEQGFHPEHLSFGADNIFRVDGDGDFLGVRRGDYMIILPGFFFAKSFKDLRVIANFLGSPVARAFAPIIGDGTLSVLSPALAQSDGSDGWTLDKSGKLHGFTNS